MRRSARARFTHRGHTITATLLFVTSRPSVSNVRPPTDVLEHDIGGTHHDVLNPGCLRCAGERVQVRRGACSAWRLAFIHSRPTRRGDDTQHEDGAHLMSAQSFQALQDVRLRSVVRAGCRGHALRRWRAYSVKFHRKGGNILQPRRQVGSDARARRIGFPCSNQQGNCRSALQSP
jgi:hypothetical protein